MSKAPCEATPARQQARAQKYFSRPFLLVYDLCLYGVISRWLWRVPTRQLDALYMRHISNNHLEAGVGTGYLLNRVQFTQARPRVALMDLNASCLRKTQRRVARYAPESYIQNLLLPVHHPIAAFDSIAINYVLHCVPGAFPVKGQVFEHLLPLLQPGGTLFGSTVLGQGVQKNLLARGFMALMNKLGVF